MNSTLGWVQQRLGIMILTALIGASMLTCSSGPTNHVVRKKTRVTGKVLADPSITWVVEIPGTAEGVVGSGVFGFPIPTIIDGKMRITNSVAVLGRIVGCKFSVAVPNRGTFHFQSVAGGSEQQYEEGLISCSSITDNELVSVEIFEEFRGNTKEPFEISVWTRDMLGKQVPY